MHISKIKIKAQNIFPKGALYWAPFKIVYFATLLNKAKRKKRIRVGAAKSRLTSLRACSKLSAEQAICLLKVSCALSYQKN